MKPTLPGLVLALLALTFIVSACAGDTGAEWTYAPVTVSESASQAPGTAAEASAPAESPTQPEASTAPADSTAQEQPAEPAGAVSGEPRVVRLDADSTLRFTDPDGQQVTDIPVTPGETIVFEIDNTAGFNHDFYIGTDAELSVPNGTTDVGIPQWESGVQTVEWVVPEDITGLKFACTVPGHYYTMQGTFSLADASAQTVQPPEAAATPAAVASDAATEVAAPEQSAGPALAASGEPRVIELEADAALRFLQNGEQIRDIPVTPGETVIFRITNTAGFGHDFYIGSDSELSVPGGSTDVGLPEWSSGVQELEWTVPDDITGLRFACTVPGHYYTMQGDFTLSP